MRTKTRKSPPGPVQGRVREVVVTAEQEEALGNALGEAQAKLQFANAVAAGILAGFGVRAAINVQLLPGRKLRFVEVPPEARQAPAP